MCSKLPLFPCHRRRAADHTTSPDTNLLEREAICKQTSAGRPLSLQISSKLNIPCRVSLSALSLKSFFRIFPIGLFGRLSTKLHTSLKPLVLRQPLHHKRFHLLFRHSPTRLAHHIRRDVLQLSLWITAHGRICPNRLRRVLVVFSKTETLMVCLDSGRRKSRCGRLKCCIALRL
jgi:hypothetical protein